jgi:protein farnesyltransferase/geranylgeranyltransferase type-1 subunit alpha
VEEPNDAVARIDYPEDFQTAYDYQRAVWKTNERSERSLRLTATCLQLNPANYTVWHFRRLCLAAVYKPPDSAADYLEIELQWTCELAGGNPKNYQIWYHRRALLEVLKKDDDAEKRRLYGAKELEYIAMVLQQDAKNYHAWSQRQWVVGTFLKDGGDDDDDVWKKEEEYCCQLIQDDIRNNSAWNHRWFVSHRGERSSSEYDVAVLRSDDAARESDYALEQIRIDPYNESSVTYWLAILKEQVFSLQDAAEVTALLSDYQEKLTQIIQSEFVHHQEGGGDGCCPPPLRSGLLEILEWKGDSSSRQQAAALADQLAEEDAIRAKYWKFRKSQLEQTLQQDASK